MHVGTVVLVQMRLDTSTISTTSLFCVRYLIRSRPWQNTNISSSCHIFIRLFLTSMETIELKNSFSNVLYYFYLARYCVSMPGKGEPFRPPRLTIWAYVRPVLINASKSAWLGHLLFALLCSQSLAVLWYPPSGLYRFSSSAWTLYLICGVSSLYSVTFLTIHIKFCEGFHCRGMTSANSIMLRLYYINTNAILAKREPMPSSGFFEYRYFHSII